jgi:hypothetical protein
MRVVQELQFLNKSRGKTAKKKDFVEKSAFFGFWEAWRLKSGGL